MILITQPFLPPKEEYEQLLEQLWDNKQIANNGLYVQELERRIKTELNVENFKYVTNGTIALQLAIKALKLKGEIITTPFSFVATTTSIIWEDCKPVFVDIDPVTLCIDPEKIEQVITENTVAIMATHVFGIPCDVERLEEIANKYQLKIIYDGAHAFGVTFKGQSIYKYGDISTYSFHATKVFHTVEGGGITCTNENLAEKIGLLRSFGFIGEDFYLPGINAKGTEFHAAMGLSNLKYVIQNFEKRKILSERYNMMIPKRMQVIHIKEHVNYNYAYYPILLDSENGLLKVMSALENNRIQTRRYFYPSLNTLPYLKEKFDCPISEDISKRILCLPLYTSLEINDVNKITLLINSIIGEAN